MTVFKNDCNYLYYLVQTHQILPPSRIPSDRRPTILSRVYYSSNTGILYLHNKKIRKNKKINILKLPRNIQLNYTPLCQNQCRILVRNLFCLPRI